MIVCCGTDRDDRYHILFVVRLKFVKISTVVVQSIDFFHIFATSSEGSGQRRGATRERRNDRV